MTNGIAIALGLVICGLIGIDLYSGSGMTLFVARKFADLVQYIAFWR